jgi:ribonucleoside-diphosphate reductase beta chain
LTEQNSTAEIAILHEPLLMDDTMNRPSVVPVKEHGIWQLYQFAKKNYWEVNEVQTEQDAQHWRYLNIHEKKFVELTLTATTANSNKKIELVTKHLATGIKMPEARSFINIQTIILTNQNKLLETLLQNIIVEDPTEK